jgi:hypothetical protein
MCCGHCPHVPPGTVRRLVTQVPPDPHVRVYRIDYSLDHRLVGERVEIKVSQPELLATWLRTGELCAHHRRRFAGGLTLTDPRPTTQSLSGCAETAVAGASPTSASTRSPATTP